MSKEQTSTENTLDKHVPFEIKVTEHEDFNATAQLAYVKSNEFCRKVSVLFRAAFNDFEGCLVEQNQQGKLTLALFFNHNEPEEGNDGRRSAVTREIPSGNNKGINNDTVRKIRQNDIKNKQGDRFYLTQAGMEALAKFVDPMMVNKRDGKIQWDKIVADVVQQPRMYNQYPINYTKVSLIDPIACATEIYGSTNSTGNVEYDMRVLSSAPQMANNGFNGVFTPEFLLEIKQVSEKGVVELCNNFGISPNQGMNIIR